MNNFLILGLPRSRTAWLANFMTYDGLSCTHEGLNGCRSLEQYRDKFVDGAGDSNTGLALYDFEHLFSGFKILVIDSPIQRAVDFAKRSYGSDVTEAMVSLKNRLDDLEGLHVDVNDINDRLDDIWNYFSPTQFNEYRAEMLTGFDIQVRDIHLTDIDAFNELNRTTKNYLPLPAQAQA